MLNICLLLPDVLGTYGDNGNALIVKRRAQMRGIDAAIHEVKLTDAVPETMDVYLMGGGEDSAQTLAVEHLTRTRAIYNVTAPFLAICAGLQVLGDSFRAHDEIVDGVGLIDATTAGLKKRAIGELKSTATGHGIAAELDGYQLTGFENHMGATILGADASPLGKVTVGVGNTDATGAFDLPDAARQVESEGVVQGNVIATYMHGPALARNPKLADLLIARAMNVPLDSLEPLDLPEVDLLRRERLAAKRVERF